MIKTKSSSSRVIAGAAFSDELQRRFVEEIPRLRLREELRDLLRTLRNGRRYSSFILMSPFHSADVRLRRIKSKREPNSIVAEPKVLCNYAVSTIFVIEDSVQR